MNYVGQPLHYILEALEKKYGTPAAVRAKLVGNPRNRFRIAHGNGAAPADRAKLVSYLGMDHVYELYGSTEAVINTVVQPGDPPDSVGRIRSSRVVILNERDEECPPAVVDARGRIVNYDEAVGEICARMTRESVLFDGYYGDPAATASKYRGNHYRSGDLGHVRVIRGKRYLYFDGRTDDWIRKDGENFSAESVAQFARAEPSVALAVAYGVPAPVSDELVAVALQLREGATLDPAALHARFLQQQREGGMDPKWMPDFVRVVESLPMTNTNKVLVRQLKREHFDLAGHPDMVIFWRRRGDAGFRRLTPEDHAALRREFEENGRGHLLGSVAVQPSRRRVGWPHGSGHRAKLVRHTSDCCSPGMGVIFAVDSVSQWRNKAPTRAYSWSGILGAAALLLAVVVVTLGAPAGELNPSTFALRYSPTVAASVGIFYLYQRRLEPRERKIKDFLAATKLDADLVKAASDLATERRVARRERKAARREREASAEAARKLDDFAATQLDADLAKTAEDLAAERAQPAEAARKLTIVFTATKLDADLVKAAEFPPPSVPSAPKRPRSSPRFSPPPSSTPTW